MSNRAYRESSAGPRGQFEAPARRSTAFSASYPGCTESFGGGSTPSDGEAFNTELTLTQAVGYGKSLCDAQTSQSGQTRQAKTRKR